jgi:hypothetical protein
MTRFVGKPLAIAAALGALLLAPLSASATNAYTDYTNTNTASCPSGLGLVGIALDGVSDAIVAAGFDPAKLSPSQASLMSKLSSANDKTKARKWGDAIAKLDDLSDSATAMAGAAKPKLRSADGINAAVVAATNCLTAP